MSTELNKNKFLSREEYQFLEATLHKFWHQELRDTAMLFTMMYTGGRPTEVLRIAKGDLDHENHTVFIKGLKGSRDRELPIPTWLFDRLELLVDFGRADTRCFNVALRTMQGIWHNYRPQSANAKGIRSLRHTFAIRLYEKTKDIRLVQMALGHRYLNTTQIYVDYVYNQEELRKLIL